MQRKICYILPKIPKRNFVNYYYLTWNFSKQSGCWWTTHFLVLFTPLILICSILSNRMLSSREVLKCRPYQEWADAEICNERLSSVCSLNYSRICTRSDLNFSWKILESFAILYIFQLFTTILLTIFVNNGHHHFSLRIRMR